MIRLKKTLPLLLTLSLPLAVLAGCGGNTNKPAPAAQPQRLLPREAEAVPPSRSNSPSTSPVRRTSRICGIR
ncbi:hypothetical protein LJK88_28205 [Paenibacillus sp. P26]|nr:hypothetical protein LJK88_28205 [Paenibacillus sp. P26]